MKHPARVIGEPPRDLWMLMGGVVVGDGVDDPARPDSTLVSFGSSGIASPLSVRLSAIKAALRASRSRACAMAGIPLRSRTPAAAHSAPASAHFAFETAAQLLTFRWWSG